MRWNICTGRDTRHKCLTFVPGRASARYKCVLLISFSLFFFFFFLFSFSHLILSSSHLIQANPIQLSNPVQIQSNKIYIYSHPKFTAILFSNHMIHNKSSITISTNLTIIHHILYKLQSHTSSQSHKTTDGTRKAHTNSSQKF
jgi:hypothetical protein